MKLWIRGGRVVDPVRGVDAVQDLWIEDGRVVFCGEPSDAPETDDTDAAATVLDASGLVVAPGFIELRAHFGEPGFEHRETLASGLAAAARGGYTAVGVLGDTDPTVDTRALVEMLLSEGARRAGTQTGFARVLPIAAVSRSMAGESLVEMGELAAAGAVALSDGERPIRNPALLRRALLYARHFDLPILARALDLDLDDGGVMHEGEHATRLGLPGSPAIAEEVAVARDLLIAAATEGRYHLAPVTTADALERVREAKAQGLSVTCDVTPQHLLLNDEAVAASGFSPALRVAPPLRTQDDVEALLAGLADGTVDAIAGGHRPLHEDEKEVQFSLAPPGVSSLEATVPVCLDRIVSRGFCDLSRLVELLSVGPARVLGLDERSFASGALGDVTLLDLDAERTIDPRAFSSRGRSTPFAGWTVRGGVAGTVVGGVVLGGEALAERLGRSTESGS